MGFDPQGTRHFPTIGADAAEFIATERNLFGIGLDTASLDANIPALAHLILAEKSMYNIESLADLSGIPFTGAHAIVLPMKIRGASGAPVRVVAILPERCSGMAHNDWSLRYR